MFSIKFLPTFLIFVCVFMKHRFVFGAENYKILKGYFVSANESQITECKKNLSK